MPSFLGPTEMIFIMVVLLLVFGAKRLPELGSGLGKGIREFKRSMSDLKGEIEREDDRQAIQPPSRAAVSAPPRETAEQSGSQNHPGGS
jgi:sec-independent protein translocase protein TatA